MRKFASRVDLRNSQLAQSMHWFLRSLPIDLPRLAKLRTEDTSRRESLKAGASAKAEIIVPRKLGCNCFPLPAPRARQQQLLYLQVTSPRLDCSCGCGMRRGPVSSTWAPVCAKRARSCSHDLPSGRFRCGAGAHRDRSRAMGSTAQQSKIPSNSLRKIDRGTTPNH